MYQLHTNLLVHLDYHIPPSFSVLLHWSTCTWKLNIYLTVKPHMKMRALQYYHKDHFLSSK